MRHYRIVRLIDRDWDRWCVVSSSLRDDDTWDVIASFPQRIRALGYLDDVIARDKTLRQAGHA